LRLVIFSMGDYSLGRQPAYALGFSAPPPSRKRR
jgi:hypothetical protein